MANPAVMNYRTDQLTQVGVGDYVCFKCDIEQCAKIVAVRGNDITVAAPADGFSGEYINGQKTHTLFAADCWI